MRLPELRITVRRLMAVVAIIAGTLAAWDWAEQAYEARRFRKAWDYAFTMGKVMRVDKAAGRVVLSLGLDDGIQIGEELYLYREGSPPQGIGRVRISALEADQSEGQLLSKVRRVQVGDGVVSVCTTPRNERVFGNCFNVAEELRKIRNHSSRPTGR
jgi:hypothetical protein